MTKIKLMRARPAGRFPMGRIHATPGALQALAEAQVAVGALLDRHHAGDWGDLDEEDWQENEYSVDKRLRLLSAYNLPTGDRLWIITEADRSVTTLLMPDEY